jgi:hypothetical protein
MFKQTTAGRVMKIGIRISVGKQIHRLTQHAGKGNVVRL